MLHSVHQLVANCMSLPFGAKPVTHDGFSELFYWKQLPSATDKKNIVVARTTKQLPETLYKAASDNTMWVYHYEPPLSHFLFYFVLSFDTMLS